MGDFYPCTIEITLTNDGIEQVNATTYHDQVDRETLWSANRIAPDIKQIVNVSNNCRDIFNSLS